MHFDWLKAVFLGNIGKAHAILSSKENLQFDNVTKETVFPRFTYFYVLFFVLLLSYRNTWFWKVLELR